jgi:putative YphP/YqiW family bacilliredoxin
MAALAAAAEGVQIEMYPEFFVAPMREELTNLGVEELRTSEAVDEAVARKGTVMVVVNSVCGCAAGKARPGVAMALQHDVKPDHVTTVFAGADVEATDRARSYFTGYPPSSPSVALLRDGQLVYMMERRQIEGQSADMIARQLMSAFDQYCAPAADRA